MNDLTKVLDKAALLSGDIDFVLKASTYDKYDDLSGLTINYKDPQELFLLDELRGIMDKLDDVKRRIDYMKRPITEEGRLRKNQSGRYQTAGGHYYTSGSVIEALIDDGYPEVPYWIKTRVEHDGEDYYLVGEKDICMDGLRVRVRG